jgi:adenylate cyclase
MRVKIRVSLAVRLGVATTLLVVALVLAVVWQWTSTERQIVFAQKQGEARALVIAMSELLLNELEDNNWGQARVSTEVLLANNPDVVYILVHDRRIDDRIVAATPVELNEQFIPDVVPLAITKVAVAAKAPLSQRTQLLRDVRIGDHRRAARGEQIVEVAATMRSALLIGGLALIFGLAGAIVLARRLAGPVKLLAEDAAQIAAGDLTHRARIDRADEIGQLADAFNDMTEELEGSFGRLRKTLESFQRFVPRKFLTVIAPEGIENIQVGTSATRTVAVLFSDIRGFTKQCEGMTPLAVFEMLNEYLGRMGNAIDQAGGFVDKYIGDAMMALFDDEFTDPMLNAILGMRQQLRAFNAERARRGLPSVEHGIGAHCGEVAMGTIGFASKIESTVIGDAVNVASRVEASTKDRSTPVLITGAVVARLRHPERYRLRKVAEGVALRGRVDPVDLYTVEDPEAPEAPDSPASIE